MESLGQVLETVEFDEISQPRLFGLLGFHKKQLSIYEGGFTVEFLNKTDTVFWDQIVKHEIAVNGLNVKMSGSFQLTTNVPSGLNTVIRIWLSNQDEMLQFSFYQKPTTKWGLKTGNPPLEPLLTQLIERLSEIQTG